MQSPLPSGDAPRPKAAAQSGFTLIELLIGVLIGLLSSLAVTQVLVNFEAQKRSTTSGSDAQINGALTLDMLQRALQPAGYGFGANQGALGCALVASFGGAAVAGFPTALAPVVITDGTSGAPDTISVLSSGKRSFSLPLRVVSPGGDATGFPLSSTLGIEGPVTDSNGAQISSGDLMVAARDGFASCDLFQSSGTTGTRANRGSGSGWNGAALTNAYVDGSYLVNLGTPAHQIFSISGESLRLSTLQLSAINGTPSYTAAAEMFSGIVNLQAQYGRDTNGDGTVDTWDNTTPTTNAGWTRLLAIRLAVVARSGQYEKEIVTTACPTWEGVSVRIPASPSACSAYPANTADEEWKHYRYKVFDTVVPLRNMLWSS
jgi:type IV pilus assembly protein PilW